MTAEEILSKIKLGMNRREVISILGEPTDFSIVTKKRKFPEVYKYDNIELHFGRGYDGILWLVYSEDEDFNPTVHAKM